MRIIGIQTRDGRPGIQLTLSPTKELDSVEHILGQETRLVKKTQGFYPKLGDSIIGNEWIPKDPLRSPLTLEDIP